MTDPTRPPVTRYGSDYFDHDGQENGFTIEPNGKFVLYTDHAAEVARLEARVKAAREEVLQQATHEELYEWCIAFMKRLTEAQERERRLREALEWAVEAIPVYQDGTKSDMNRSQVRKMVEHALRETEQPKE